MTGRTIGKVAKMTGVRAATVRFYERRGLIEQPDKPAGGYRVYPEETVRRIRFIRRAQSLGFSLSEIGELLSLQGIPGSDCGDVRDCAAGKLEQVNGKMEELNRIREELEALISDCPGRGSLRSCNILRVLEEEDGNSHS